MKNNYKMRIICLLCIFTAAFSSCKKNELAEEKGLAGNHKNLAIAGDGKWDLLGHGYDITGELFERKNASKVSIINIDAFYTAYPNRIPTPTDTKGGYNVYYGADAYDYVKDINNKQTFGATVVGGDKAGAYATNNFSLTNEKQNTYTYNSKYSYATYESWFRIKSIDFTDDVTVDLLKNYLTPDFLAYISNYSAEEIVKTYGTHILLGIDIGGRLKYDYRGSVVKETTFDRKLRAIKAGFSIGIAKIFSIDLNADLTKEEKTTISNETTDKLFAGTFYGGNNSGTNFSGDAQGNTSENINLVSWQQSINTSNASLIGINRSAPIYEFITDPVKKQQVKDAVEKYIKDRQIVVTQDYSSQSVNVNSFVAKKDSHHYLTTGVVDDWNYWRAEGPIFRAFSKNLSGTVPIYTFFSQRGSDHYYTTGTVTDFSWWRGEGIAFYAYKTQVTGTIPIYEHFSSSGADHFYSPDPSRTLGDPSYWNQVSGPVFYAYPVK